MPTRSLDFIRIALYAILIALVLFLYQAYQKEHSDQSTITTTPSIQTPESSQNTIPSLPEQVTHSHAISSAPLKKKSDSHLIHIETDVLSADIDTVGGNFTQIKLLQYPEKLYSTEPFLLLNNTPDTRYLAQSGLISTEGPDTSETQAHYTADKKSYTLSNDKESMEVVLHWKNNKNISVDKVLTFKKNHYDVDVNYIVHNQSAQPWDGHLYFQLLRKNSEQNAHQNGLTSTVTYFGGAISSPDKRFQKISFKQMGQTNLNQTITGGWAAMIQHYFVSAWIPDHQESFQYFSKVNADNLYTIGMMSAPLSSPAGMTSSFHSTFYSGPLIADYLNPLSPTLKLSIDYGWFWFISGIIFWMMQHIYDVVGNWGWSIVIVTLIIKLLFFHLSAKSYRSMSGMKTLQPKLVALKERFAEDKQKLTQATIELYKKEKINPMSGCLPILIQIPVFIGLYWVLIESVELRQAPFILWIHDLSMKDPFYVLPLLMGLSMFLQQRLNPPSSDPTQAKIMLFMPVVFTALFMNFPAGLMLYWFVNNTLSFLQQWFIMRSINKK